MLSEREKNTLHPCLFSQLIFFYLSVKSQKQKPVGILEESRAWGRISGMLINVVMLLFGVAGTVISSICPFLWCTCSHCGESQASKVLALNGELGKRRAQFAIVGRLLRL